MSLIKELKRRNVFRVGIAYLVLSWLILQVVDVVAPMLELPDWAPRLFLLILAICLIPALIIAWVYEITPEGLRKESELDPDRSTTQQAVRKLDILTIALLLIVVVVIAADWLLSGRIREVSVQTSGSEQTRQAQAQKNISIAVLPFVNMSADPDQEYFSDGISEELLNVLAQFPGLRVAARTSAFQFKGQSRDIAEIARQLRVNHVLEGSVRKAGNRLRITAQLIDAENGFHLWSESWDRELDDIFAIQDEISAAISDALEIKLALDSGESPAVLPSIPAAASAQAYEYYLKGRQLINGRNRRGIEHAVTALEGALELDERYAPGHAQLAIAYALLKKGAGSYGELGMDEVLVRSTPHVDRAFELDPDLAEAYGAKALLALTNADYPTAIENAKRALALNPSYVDALNWLYLSLVNSARWPEAVETMDHMMTVDPLSIVGQINYSYALARYGRFEEARAVADGLARQSLIASYLSHALISGDYTGQIADSVSWYLKVIALDPGNSANRNRLAINFIAIGEYDEARRIAPDSRWMIDAAQLRWEDALAHVRQQLEENPTDRLLKVHLADILHRSGDLPAAQVLYEELLIDYGGNVILDWRNTSVMPTARMAYGRLAGGDSESAREILDLVRNDLQLREQAGVRESYLLRAAAMVAAMENDPVSVATLLHEAIDTGLRDPYILREPAFEPFQDDAGFRAAKERLDTILDEERKKTLRLICFENPAVKVWQPLAETCVEGTESS